MNFSETASDGAAAAPAPRSPGRGFAWAAAWTVVAIFGGVVLFLDGARIFSGEVQGQRTAGLLISTPLIALALAVVIGVRAFRAIKPWKAYVARTTPAEREMARLAPLQGTNPVAPLVAALVFFVLWLAGAIAVTVFFPHLAKNTAGLFVALMFLALLTMGWVALVGVWLRSRAASRA